MCLGAEGRKTRNELKEGKIKFKIDIGGGVYWISIINREQTMSAQIYLGLCNHKTQKRFFSVGYKKASILIQSPWEIAGKEKKKSAINCKKQATKEVKLQCLSKNAAGRAKATCRRSLTRALPGTEMCPHPWENGQMGMARGEEARKVCL